MYNWLSVDDELNLYLVANGLKPASLITLSPFSIIEGYGIIAEDNMRHVQKRGKTRIKKSDVRVFETFLGEIVEFSVNYKDFFKTLNEKGKKAAIENIHYNIGHDRSCLDQLIRAKEPKAEGIALGFPVLAVNSFSKIINGECRDGQYFQVCLAKAKKAGIKIPSWLGYISFIPEELDIVNGSISESSKAIGEQYQTFVRKHNPNLARRIEKMNENRLLPVSWKPDGYGSYGITFS